MFYDKLGPRLDSKPLVLCGPILRRVEPESVTVWVALRRPRMVTLQVFKKDQNGQWANQPEQSETVQTVPIGAHLHVVAVTTRPGNKLKWGELYGYNLTFAPVAGAPSDKAGVGDLFNGADAVKGTTGVVAASTADARKLLTYTETLPQAPTLPSFILPPDASKVPQGSHPLDHLRVCHGSCRKAHGESIDGLATMDNIIRQSLRPGSPDPRPHMLLLGGDQIYADDVADALLTLLTDAGDTLLGWEEQAPGGEYIPAPGNRAAFAERIGLTAMVKDSPESAKSHLARFGEYAAMYLFVWSEELWPAQLPRLSEVYNGYIEGIARSEVGERFRQEDERLQLLRSTLPKVRRAFANVPTYMIFDDHEISDDWYLNREWCAKVLDKKKNPTGRRVILNGLLAYAVFQAWGNTPDLFRPNDPSAPGWLLLDAATKWRGVSDKNSEKTEAELFTRLNIPTYEDGKLLALPPADPVMRWHYTINTPHFQALILDTRTMRGFPGGAQDPPALLNDEAFRMQIDEAPPPPADGVTLVLAPTNVVSEPLTEFFVDVIAKTSSVYSSDKGDAWVPQSLAFELFLSKLANRAPDTGAPRREMRYVISTGDIHYGFAVRMQYWADFLYRAPGDKTPVGRPVDAVFAELTASSFRNEAFKTRTIQERAFLSVKNVQLFKEMMSVKWIGWSKPLPRKEVFIAPELNLTGVAKAGLKYYRLAQTPSMLKVDNLPLGTHISFRPDWRYRIDFIKDETPSPDTDIVITRPPDPPRGWLEQQMRLVSEAHKNYAEGGFGRTVVGRNNIGEMRFRWGWGDDKWVTQKLWWRLLETAEPAPLTEYNVSLRLFTNKYPKFKYPGEG